MRELLTPHEPIRYRAGDFLALWRCDEASGSLVDVTGSYSAAVAVGTIGAAGSLFGSPAGTTGARTFSSSRATATGNTAARTALLGEWTISAWVQASTIAGLDRYILTYAGGNTLASLALTSAGVPFVSWRQGTTTITATSTATLTTGRAYHLAAVKDADPSNAGRWRVTFYVDGVQAGQTVNLLNPDGGTTSPQWSIGTNSGGASAWAGTLDDIAVLTYAANAQMVRDIYARGASSVDARTVYDSTFYAIHTRVLVYTAAGAAVDLSEVYGWDLLRNVEIDDDVDNQGATLRLDVVRDVYEVNVAPLMATSAPNVDAGGTLFAINRRVVVETATVPEGTQAGGILEWVVLFDGFIEGVDFAGDVMSVRAMDRIQPLQDTWIEPDRSTTPPEDRQYGSAVSVPGSEIPVETDIQRLINDNAPSGGYVGGTPTLYTPTSPGWSLNMVTALSDSSVIGRIDEWVSQIGWQCRYRWDDHRKAYRLTLYEPQRTKTSSDYTLGSRHVLEYQRMEVSRDEIRNAIDVEYGSAVNTNNLLQWERRTIYREDATSIARYGRRYCRVGIGTNQEINDAASAARLADAIISDLKEPKADVEVSMLFRHFFEVGDVVRLSSDGQRLSTSQTFSVVGLTHSLSPTERRTRLRLRGATPTGKRSKWWDFLATLGRVSLAGIHPLPAPEDITYVPTLGGIRLTWTYPVNAGARQYLETEIHRSTLSSFTPSSSTLLATVRGKSSAVIEQLPGSTRFVRLIHRDTMGVASPPSAQLVVESNQLSTAYVPDAWRAACHVRQRGSQAWVQASSSGIAPLANLVDVDTSTGSLWNASAQRVEPQIKGVYALSANVGLSVSAAPGVGIALLINGALSQYVSPRIGSTPTINSVAGSWLVTLQRLDQVSFVLVSETAKAVDVTTQAGQTHVSASLVFALP